MRVCLAAGGTGGHLLPGLSVAKELRARGHSVHFIVRSGHASQEFLAREGFASSAFYFEGFPRGVSLRAAFFPVRSAVAYSCAHRILRRERPDVVLGMGGYTSVPAGVAARFLRVPLIVHEQNSRAGLANRLLSRWAAAVATSFDPTEGLPSRCRPVTTGLPLRPDLSPRPPAEARRSVGLDGEAMTVLIFGGSQGARALNRLILNALPGLASRRNKCQFIHITGEADRAEVEKEYRDGGWRAFVPSYWHDMSTLYSAADFVVSRAGANSVMELARFGLKALLVPFPYATDDHQQANARYLVAAGQAVAVPQADLSPERLVSIFDSLPEPSVLREENRRRLESVPEAVMRGARRLADVVESVVAARLSPLAKGEGAKA